ncbi:MAG: DUF2892 domain-containing protein [Acidobacteriota bacterium]|nr:DUF2892 domain-containing protein [Acidobacteriota bacterium]
MLQNVGSSDRALRILAGLVLLASVPFVHGAWRWLALPGAVLLVTGLARVCPAYLPFGIRTTGKSR